MANVLVVDDEESDRVGLSAILEGAGHTVHAASDGREALALYLAHPIHVVVTDLVMPGRDGLDLIAKLTDVRPDVAIVAVSGKGQTGLSIADVMGARAVLHKPVDAEDLVRAVEEALGG